MEHLSKLPTKHSEVTGIGSVIISKEITLKSVLFVPDLDYNLLSISKLTKDLNCVTKFSSTLYEFQALSSRRTIGNAKMSAGLYLSRTEAPGCLPQKISCSASSQNRESALLWHYRLGHPSFIYLKMSFPNLINKSLVFQCEICQLSKHPRNSFPIQPYKKSHPFYMIHSDIWGPSRIKNISGHRWLVTFIDDHTHITWLFLMKENQK